MLTSRIIFTASHLIALAACWTIAPQFLGAEFSHAQDSSAIPRPPCKPYEWASIFFDAAPAETTAPLVLRVTVTRLMSTYEATSGGPMPHYGDTSANVEARVDEVIKGSMESTKITIDTHFSRCPIEMKIGESGIILGRREPLNLETKLSEVQRIIVRLNRPYIKQ